MTSILIRDKREENTETHGEVHVKTEAEIGVTQTQAKESPESLKAGRGKGRFFPRTFRGSMSWPDTLISHSGLQNCERVNSYRFKPRSLWCFVMTAPGNQGSDGSS